MREIRFRAWDNIQKIMIYDNNKIGILLNGELVDIAEKCEGEENTPFYNPMYGCELNSTNFILMQFTGLLDKNGKEIYEGDIIRVINDAGKEILAICEFGIARRKIFENEVDIPSFYFRVPEYENRKTFPIVHNYAGKHDLDLYEVIGNIYENPELLEDNK